MSLWDQLVADSPPEADLAHAAHRARWIAAAAGRPDLDRWLQLEVEGYDELPDRMPLSQVLRVHDGHPLVHEVAAYRTQVGVMVVPGDGVVADVRPYPHFFVEPLAKLATMDGLTRENRGEYITLRFGPDPARGPSTAEYPADVFARILLGFREALERQLRGAA